MEDISELLAPLLENTDVPSVAAAVVFGSEIRAAGAVGVRKRGDETPVTVNDKYHVGSCAKAMTATLAGVLVERGLLSWETRIQDVFPEMVIHPGYEPVTLKQLLSHTSGMPAFTDPSEDVLEDEVWEAVRPPDELRRESVLPAILKEAPRTTPGESFGYSNMGYITTGAMLEQLTRTPFETLLQNELFRPLGMTSAGFGAPATLGAVDQPYGHDPDPVDPQPYGDNPPVLSPAGTAHMSILDFAKHAAFHLAGEPKLLSKKTLELLHTPVREGYALGWRVSERPWAGGDGLTHNGSNTMFLAFAGVAPKKNKALVYATNTGTQEGVDIVVELFKTLARRYLDK